MTVSFSEVFYFYPSTAFLRFATAGWPLSRFQHWLIGRARQYFPCHILYFHACWCFPLHGCIGGEIQEKSRKITEFSHVKTKGKNFFFQTRIPGCGTIRRAVVPAYFCMWLPFQVRIVPNWGFLAFSKELYDGTHLSARCWAVAREPASTTVKSGHLIEWRILSKLLYDSGSSIL